MAATTSPPAPTASDAQGVATARVKKVRGPWLAAGGLLIALSVLGAMYLYSQVSSTDQYLMAMTDISRGDVLDREQLGVIALAGDQLAQADLISPAQADSILGMRATADISPGTIMSSSLVSESDQVPEGHSLVGLVVDVGTYPISHVGVGDSVALMNVGRDALASGGAATEAARVEIYSRTQMTGGETPRLFFTLQVPNDRVATATGLIGSGSVWLVQVDPDTPPLTVDFTEIPDGVLDEDDATEFDILGDLVVHYDLDVAVVFGDDPNGNPASLASTVFFDLDGDGVDDDTGEEIPDELLDLYLN